MRNALAVLWILLGSIASAAAQVSVGIGLPGVSIGINLPVYPQLVPVPGYPVYYAPQVNSNYFFYDGMYWIYQRDNWYASSWYNGPWMLVGPEAVPLFVLRVPVHYYRQPPVYFRGWHSDAPPRWGEHWGNSWQQSHRGWDNWDRRAVYTPAPLPAYQRQYSGNRYPHGEQQQALQNQNYRYQPRDAAVQQHYQAQQPQSAPAAVPQGRPGGSQERSAQKHPQPVASQPIPVPQSSPPVARVHPPQPVGGGQPRPVTPSSQTLAPQPQQAAVPRQQQQPKSLGQDIQSQGRAPAQMQTRQPQQAAASRQQQTAWPGQPNAPQGRLPAQEAQARHLAPQQGGARQEQSPRAQVKAPSQEARQSQEKGREKGEPQGAEHNK